MPELVATVESIDGTLHLPRPPLLPALAPALRRALKHPRAMHYNRIIALVGVVNGAVVALHLWRGDWRVADGTALAGLSDLILVNLAVAVLIRQQHVLNVIFALAGRGSSRWPLALRWTVSKVNHMVGLHVGAAVAGTASSSPSRWSRPSPGPDSRRR
jgi:hypothetical protein